MIDALWIVLATGLVFFMQAGFAAFEAGMVKENNAAHVALKNLIDWVILSVVFFFVGFGIMFGKSFHGLFGTTDFFLSDLLQNETKPFSLAFFMFQMAFGGTALTIVSGAMSGRTGFIPYLVSCILLGAIIYPVFGHWAWGNLYDADSLGWLAKLGFIDFAGSTVVHSIGAWVGLVGIYLTGPRIGRFDANGKVNEIKANSYPLSILGVFILWFGWWGFNGGSVLAFNEQVITVIFNTNLAASAAALSAFLHCNFIQKKDDIKEKILGGTLTGLVAITASANIVTPMGALAIGFIAGVIHNLAYDFLLYDLKLDDPVGAIPVHGAGGIFGTLAVAIFGQESMLAHDRISQLGIQVIGVSVAFLWTTSIAFLVFYVIKKTVGLRVSPSIELSGLQLSEELNLLKTTTDAELEEALDLDEIESLLKG